MLRCGHQLEYLDLEFDPESPLWKYALQTVVSMCPRYRRLRLSEGHFWLTPLLAQLNRVPELHRIEIFYNGIFRGVFHTNKYFKLILLNNFF